MSGAARLAGMLALALALLVRAAPASAQVRPDADWRTLRTAHLRVHFPRELELLARRAAADAELAWARLAAELRPPRGPVDLVLTDEVDVANGSATVFPTNRVVIYAHPPVSAAALRFYEDWLRLVITHELAHVFHLDRADGWWGVAQRLVGRHPGLFPNTYLPAWITEGLAVHYESRLAGAGRIEGTVHPMLARAAALDGHVPRLDELSLATNRFPGGEMAYAYGGLLFERAAGAHGPEAVPRFVRSSSRLAVPFLVDRAARSAFGESFTATWRRFRDSLDAIAPAERAPLPGWRRLGDPAWSVEAPRWLGDSALLVGVNTGREVPGAYLARASGAVRRLGRRNTLDRNVPLPGGSVLFAQLDYVDAYAVRSDLWVERGGVQRRLTRGARLAAPDVRADGAIVAVQAVPGGTRLVRVAPDGTIVGALTTASADTQWTEPRWSPDGRRIAAVRLARGAVSEVVVLDTTGRELAVPARARAVSAAPAWTPDGERIVFGSDVGGRPELWEVRADGGMPPRRLSDAATGLFQPDLAPDGERVTAVRFGAHGWELGVGRLPDVSRDTAHVAADGEPAWREPASVAAPPPPSDAPVERYAAWRTLLPRWWTPSLRAGDQDATLVGVYTSGRDVVGRHAWSAEALVNVATGDREYAASWRWAGLGQPLVDAAWRQSWDRDPLRNTEGAVVGELARRTQVAALAATLLRPRFRTSAFVAVGAELESWRYETDPAPLLDALPEFYRGTPRYPAVRLSAGWGNARHPTLAVSPEDGVRLSGTVRQRWLADDVAPFTRSAVGQVAAYRSLPFIPGDAHHVLALRVSGAWADDAASGTFDVGGVDAGALEIVPGFVLGDGPRLLGVRGFAAEAQEGNRAAAASLEWRAPLATPARGLGLLPLFVNQVSGAAFVDAGSAWCSAGAVADRRPGCTRGPQRPRWLAGAGAELVLEAALLSWDAPVQFRLGVATPVRGEGGATSAYVTVGRGF